MVFKIITEIIKQPDHRFENVPKLLSKAIFEFENIICKSSKRIEKELKFSQKLKKYPQMNITKVSGAGVLGRLLGKDKGEEVYWYEIRLYRRKYKWKFFNYYTQSRRFGYPILQAHVIR